jgi:hypothetical protein
MKTNGIKLSKVEVKREKILVPPVKYKARVYRVYRGMSYFVHLGGRIHKKYGMSLDVHRGG